MEACVSPAAADDAAERRRSPCRFPARRGQRPPRLSHGSARTHWLPPLLGAPPGGPEPPSPAPFPCRKTAPKPEAEVRRAEREGPRPRGTDRGRGCRQQRCTHQGSLRLSAGPGRLPAVSPTRPFAAQPGSRRAWKGCRPVRVGRWQQ
ncbi:unnamed protein product [Coccothraustes coccothraustes]